jgi:tetratricopeptide (TPR) repeat protein
MGVALTRLLRYDEARAVLEESVAVTRETGERLLEAHALAALAEVSVHLGRREAARECLEAALRLRQRLGDASGADDLFRRLAQLPDAREGSRPH